MGALKPKMVLRLFEQLGFQTIVLADTDTVWLRDPESTNAVLMLWEGWSLHLSERLPCCNRH